MRALDFFKEVKVELEKVVWPTKAQTIQLTMLVIGITIIVGFFVGLLDFGLTYLTGLVIK